MLKGLIFDMDGTITLTEQLHHRAFSEVFAQYGVNDFSLEEEVTKYAGSGSETIFRRVLEERGIFVTDHDIERCIAAKRDLYTKIVQSESKIETVPGVIEFVKHTEEEGLKRIIATGNSNLEIVRFILKKIGLESFFPHIISVTEVSRGKPFPDVFLEAAHRLKLAPSECLVLEDAINGVKSAGAAGIRCVALETTTAAPLLKKAGADAVIKNFYQLTDELLYGTSQK